MDPPGDPSDLSRYRQMSSADLERMIQEMSTELQSRNEQLPDALRRVPDATEQPVLIDDALFPMEVVRTEEVVTESVVPLGIVTDQSILDEEDDMLYGSRRHSVHQVVPQEPVAPRTYGNEGTDLEPLLPPLRSSSRPYRPLSLVATPETQPAQGTEAPAANAKYGQDPREAGIGLGGGAVSDDVEIEAQEPTQHPRVPRNPDETGAFDDLNPFPPLRTSLRYTPLPLDDETVEKTKSKTVMTSAAQTPQVQVENPDDDEARQGEDGPNASVRVDVGVEADGAGIPVQDQAQQIGQGVVLDGGVDGDSIAHEELSSSVHRRFHSSRINNPRTVEQVFNESEDDITIREGEEQAAPVQMDVEGDDVHDDQDHSEIHADDPNPVHRRFQNHHIAEPVNVHRVFNVSEETPVQENPAPSATPSAPRAPLQLTPSSSLGFPSVYAPTSTPIPPPDLGSSNTSWRRHSVPYRDRYREQNPIQASPPTGEEDEGVPPVRGMSSGPLRLVDVPRGPRGSAPPVRRHPTRSRSPHSPPRRRPQSPRRRDPGSPGSDGTLGSVEDEMAEYLNNDELGDQGIIDIEDPDSDDNEQIEENAASPRAATPARSPLYHAADDFQYDGPGSDDREVRGSTSTARSRSPRAPVIPRSPMQVDNFDFEHEDPEDDADRVGGSPATALTRSQSTSPRNQRTPVPSSSASRSVSRSPRVQDDEQDSGDDQMASVDDSTQSRSADDPGSSTTSQASSSIATTIDSFHAPDQSYSRDSVQEFHGCLNPLPNKNCWTHGGKVPKCAFSRREVHTIRESWAAAVSRKFPGKDKSSLHGQFEQWLRPAPVSNPTAPVLKTVATTKPAPLQLDSMLTWRRIELLNVTSRRDTNIKVLESGLALLEHMGVNLTNDMIRVAYKTQLPSGRWNMSIDVDFQDFGAIFDSQQVLVDAHNHYRSITNPILIPAIAYGSLQTAELLMKLRSEMDPKSYMVHGQSLYERSTPTTFNTFSLSTARVHFRPQFDSMVAKLSRAEAKSYRTLLRSMPP